MKKTAIIICVILIIVIAIVSNILDNNINGQTIAILGDSLMEGHGNDNKSFEYYFSNLLPSSKFINNSKSGATISTNTGTDNIVLINQVKSLKGNPDIIIFDGGANDIICYGMGFLDNSLKKEIGTIDDLDNTVIGDFKETIEELKNKFPNTKLYYIQMFLIDERTLDYITFDEVTKKEITSRRDLLFEQIKLLCNQMGVQYIDVSNKLVGLDHQYIQDDYIHLKEEGYKLLTPYILEKMKN